VKGWKMQEEGRLPWSGADQSPGVIGLQGALVIYQESFAVFGEARKLKIVLVESDEGSELQRI
jgi:hypothetical protein